MKIVAKVVKRTPDNIIRPYNQLAKLASMR